MADISQVRVNNTDYNFADDTKVPYDLLQDTVGFTSKNLLPFPYSGGTSKTENGITWTVNADGSVTANGTCTGNYSTFILRSNANNISLPSGRYKLTGCPSGGGQSTYWIIANLFDGETEKDLNDQGNGSTQTYNNAVTLGTGGNIYIRIFSGTTVSNLVFRPMLRKADIMDSTYEQYRKPVPQYIEDRIKDTVGWSSKNIVSYPYDETTKTQSGITFTDNKDGSVTVNGTATGNAVFNMWNINHTKEYFRNYKGKTFIASGGKNNVEFGIQGIETQAVGKYSNNGNEISFIVNNNIDSFPDSLFVKILVRTGVTANNVTIYPMIRLADDLSPTYEPYNPSVKQILRNNKIIEGKNLIPYPYEEISKVSHGVTFTDNGDGSITLNGTPDINIGFYLTHNLDLPSGNYTVSMKYTGTISGNKASVRIGHKNDTWWVEANTVGQSEKDFVINDSVDNDSVITVSIQLTSGVTFTNFTVYPMIRKATETDSTYEPYYIPGVVSQEAQNILGAKNLLPYPYKETTLTRDGITFTDNGDGSITMNGTATQGTNMELFGNTKIYNNMSFRLSGCFGGSNTTYWLALRIGKDSGDSYVDSLNEYNNEDFIYQAGYAKNDEHMRLMMHIERGVTLNNVKIWPMMRPLSVNDNTYTPYAMTNRELTEIQNIDLSNFFTDSDITNVTDSFIRKIGRVVIGHLQFKFAKTTINTDYTIATLPIGFRPSTNVPFSTSDTGSGSTNERHDCYVSANGGLKIVLRNTHSADRWMMVNFMYFVS